MKGRQKIILILGATAVVCAFAGVARSAFPGQNGQIVFQREGQCALNGAAAPRG
jgi:hypothetical protein